MGGPPNVPSGFRVSTIRHGGTAVNCSAVWATADIAITIKPNASSNITERQVFGMCFLQNRVGRARYRQTAQLRASNQCSDLSGANSGCVSAPAYRLVCWE